MEAKKELVTAFKGSIRKFFNMVAVHIEGQDIPSLFSCQCPFHKRSFFLNTFQATFSFCMEIISAQNCNFPNDIVRKSVLLGEVAVRDAKMAVNLGWSGSKGLSGLGNTVGMPSLYSRVHPSKWKVPRDF
jgi:hypothetical protein